jgi:hypothetical protein
LVQWECWRGVYHIDSPKPGVTSLRDSKTFPLAPPPALPCRAFTCRRSAAGICNDRPQSTLSGRFFRSFGACSLSLLGTHDLRRGLQTFAASRLDGHFAATVERRWSAMGLRDHHGVVAGKTSTGAKARSGLAWNAALEGPLLHGGVWGSCARDSFCTRAEILSLLRSWILSLHGHPRLASWAAIFRGFAAGL